MLVRLVGEVESGEVSGLNEGIFSVSRAAVNLLFWMLDLCSWWFWAC